MNYTAINSTKDIPNTKKKVTVVVSCDEEEGAIVICEYQHGKCVDGGIYFDINDVSDDILDIKYRKDIYVEETAEVAFCIIREHAEIYRECDGDLDKIAAELDKRMAGLC